MSIPENLLHHHNYNSYLITINNKSIKLINFHSKFNLIHKKDIHHHNNIILLIENLIFLRNLHQIRHLNNQENIINNN